MDAGISRACCLGFLVYRAGWCKNMFEHLQTVELVSMKYVTMPPSVLLIREDHCEEGCSMDLWGHTCSSHTRTWATDLQPLESCHWWASCESWKPHAWKMSDYDALRIHTLSCSNRDWQDTGVLWCRCGWSHGHTWHCNGCEEPMIDLSGWSNQWSNPSFPWCHLPLRHLHPSESIGSA